MQYRTMGNTGIQISALGFGAMRLPSRRVDGKEVFDHEAGARLLRQGIDAGINYVDTAPYYCEAESELIVGEALRDGYRDRVYLSTKLPGEDRGYDASRKRLEASLARLGTDHIDFYHLWGISWDRFETQAQPEGQVRMALQAKEEGLIRHLSFSFHDAPENLIKFVDTGLFASVLCQYNLLDRTNEEAIAYAHQKGLGVVIMGPVGGGRLGVPSQVVQSLLPGKLQSSPQIALRFVLTNPHVTCALSGMGNLAMVQENARVAGSAEPLTPDEQQRIAQSMQENKKRAQLYCTGCNYCMPCPAEVNIPLNFEIMNYHQVYDLTPYAKEQYAAIGRYPWMPGKPASACVGCGQCEKKCPQHLKIREQLAQTDQALA
ncbi:MAG: aldo/keto reductase [Oscillospiraceae bacterium]|jgi:predicted aldo/keto reductase-like oxidoreductase|nr:aldo/keto reductase [Oscillospiraceae bacterium]